MVGKPIINTHAGISHVMNRTFEDFITGQHRMRLLNKQRSKILEIE